MDTLTPEKEPKGPILGIVIIIVLLIVGGIYIFMNERRAVSPDAINTTPEATILGPESASADLDVIQTELEVTNLNSLDAELKDINAELNIQ